MLAEQQDQPTDILVTVERYDSDPIPVPQSFSDDEADELSDDEFFTDEDFYSDVVVDDFSL